MASADVKLNLAPQQFKLIIEALESYRDEYADQCADMTMKDEERSEAGQIMWACDVLLRQING